MADVNRMRIAWGGTNIAGPGVTTLWFVGSMTGVPAAVVTLFTAHANLLPPGGSLTVPSSGDTIQISDGTLTGGWTASGGATITSAGTGNWIAGAGAVVDISTAAVFRNRRVKGRYFLVPVVDTHHQNNGTIVDATVASQNTSIATFLSAVTGKWVIYSRPHSKAAADGGVNTVTAAAMADRATQLRSRRV